MYVERERITRGIRFCVVESVDAIAAASDRVASQHATFAQAPKDLAQRAVADLARRLRRQLPAIVLASLDETSFLQHARQVLQLFRHPARFVSQNAADGLGVDARGVVGLYRSLQVAFESADVVHFAHQLERIL